MAAGLRLYRRDRRKLNETNESDETEEVEAAEVAEVVNPDAEVVFTVEEVAAKFGRLFRRAGAEFARARQLTRLLDARVQLGDRILAFRHGRLAGDDLPSDRKPESIGDELTDDRLPWSDLDVDTFDRMSIVRSALEFSNVELDGARR